jgi:hypothetical protein
MKKNRKPLSKKIRFEVFKRDSFCCQYCGESAPKVILHIDHVIPVCEGGSDEIMNLVTSCIDCNQGKSGRKISDDSALVKMKRQADAIQERSAQISMMAQWYQEMSSIENQEIDLIESRLIALCDNGLSETGRNIFAKLIKKYGLAKVIERVELCFDFEINDSQTFSRQLEKLKKELVFSSKPLSEQKARYIAAVIRNRYKPPEFEVNSFRRLMILIFEWNIESHKRFYKIAANSKTAQDALNQMIEAGVELGIPHGALKDEFERGENP